MANISMQQNGDACAAIGLVTRYEASFTIALTGGVSYLGFVTPPGTPIRVLGRSYGSSDSPLTIELLEATFTGGTATRTLNRNLTLPVNAPVNMLTNVTPGTFFTGVLTGVTLRSSPALLGASQVSIAGDTNTLILKPNTNYVIRFTNGGGLNAQISAGIDLRFTLPSDYVTLKPNEI